VRKGLEVRGGTFFRSSVSDATEGMELIERLNEEHEREPANISD
jgi:hypothetical protein